MRSVASQFLYANEKHTVKYIEACLINELIYLIIRSNTCAIRVVENVTEIIIKDYYAKITFETIIKNRND